MKIESLLDGDPKPVSEFNFGTAVPESFVFSRDGKYLFGSSYYTGVSNIYRYEIATGEVEAVSNAETGFFRPVPLSDGSMLVFHYTGDGFVPARIQAEPLEDLSAVKFLGAMVARNTPSYRGGRSRRRPVSSWTR
jgi:Tol biopolymer transport system component